MQLIAAYYYYILVLSYLKLQITTMCNYYPVLLNYYLNCNSLQHIIIILVLSYLKLQITTMCNYYPALLYYLFKLQLTTIYNYYPIILLNYYLKFLNSQKNIIKYANFLFFVLNCTRRIWSQKLKLKVSAKPILLKQQLILYNYYPFITLLKLF